MPRAIHRDDWHKKLRKAMESLLNYDSYCFFDSLEFQAIRDEMTDDELIACTRGLATAVDCFEAAESRL